MREGFVARCVRCGAPHSLALLDASARCAHCGAIDPLGDEARARVEAAADKVSRLAWREQHAQRKHEDASLESGLLMGLFGGVSWLLFGGIAFAMVFSEKPEAMGLVELLGTSQSASGNTAEMGVVMAWWLLVLLLAGLGATVFFSFSLLFYQRKPLAPLRALPPLDASSPPRCHLCGGGLAAGGLARRCRYCGASNLVDGRSFDAQIDALSEQLSVIDHALVERAIPIGRSIDSMVKFSAFFPIALLLFFPLTMVGTPRTMPELLPALAVIWALAFVAILLWLSRFKSHARHVSDVACGDAVLVRGRPFVVRALVEAKTNGLVPSQRLLLLEPRSGSNDWLLVDTQWRSLEEGHRALALARPTEPRAPSAQSVVVPLVFVDAHGVATPWTAVTGPEIALCQGANATSAPAWIGRWTPLHGEAVVLV
ncbi:MAG: hypothetical protein JNK05_29010 [Myxococcales bacterium]|nr:hypothetical protein [Myxococcales bacterium]